MPRADRPRAGPYAGGRQARQAAPAPPRAGATGGLREAAATANAACPSRKAGTLAALQGAGVTEPVNTSQRRIEI